MLKKISQKIEQVRLEPEHIRLRYVWGSVTVSMIVIVAIWIFSISAMFQKENKDNLPAADAGTNLTEQLQNLKEQAPSLKDYANQPLSVDNEGVTAQQPTGNNDFQYPTANTDTTETPQADAYSKLSDPDSNQ